MYCKAIHTQTGKQAVGPSYKPQKIQVTSYKLHVTTVQPANFPYQYHHDLPIEHHLTGRAISAIAHTSVEFNNQTDHAIYVVNSFRVVSTAEDATSVTVTATDVTIMDDVTVVPLGRSTNQNPQSPGHSLNHLPL